MPFFLGLILIAGVCFTEEDFYISEIYANAPARKSNNKKMWLELRNISDHQLPIQHLGYELFYEPNSVAALKIALVVDPPVVLNDFLILAQSPTLGEGFCFKADIPVVLMKDFGVATNKWQKICITVNHQKTSCAILTKKDRLLDGTSLYRSPHASWWLPESCELKDGIFATPGQEELSCLGNLEEALQECLESENKPALTKLSPSVSREQPFLNIEERNNGYSVLVSDRDYSDMWQLRTCVAHTPKAKLCRQVEEYPVLTEQKNSYPFPQLLPSWGAYLQIGVQDLFSRSDEKVLKYENVSQQYLLTSKFRREKNSLLVSFEMPKNRLPANYQVVYKGVIVLEGAFIEPGRKTIELDPNWREDDLKILFSSIAY